ncbi:MAG: diacylglycerol kinase family protein [Myxococcota bacterium]
MARLLPSARTFGHAFRGLASMYRTEFNARFHVSSAILVTLAGLAIGLPRFEWMILVLTMSAVLALEAVNTAIEAICDVVSPEQNAEIGRAKDVAAGAVLIASLAAVVIAVLVFGHRVAALAASA